MARKLLFFVADGNINNILTTIMVAIESRESECEASVILTEAAIPILIEGKLTLAPPLEDYARTIRKNLREITAGSKPMYERATDAGVSLYVSETWLQLLGIDKAKVPLQFEVLPMQNIIDLIRESDVVIGKI